MRDLRGIYPALLTPFDKNGKINEAALQQLVRYNVDKGVTGFYVGGSTAEAFLLSTEEREYILDIVMDAAGGKAAVISHVGAISTDVAVRLAKYAKKCGADAVSAIPPFYYNFTPQEIAEYYRSICDESQMPMIIYSFPGCSGVKLKADGLKRLLDMNFVIGLKYTDSDYFTMQQVRAACPDAILFNGFDETFLAGLAMGADGGIGSTYNFMAEKFIKMRTLFLEGNLEEAQAIQKEANQIIQTILPMGVMPAEKAILGLLGIDAGVCRRPFRHLSTEEIEQLETNVLPLLA